jgi:hypothetical protein
MNSGEWYPVSFLNLNPYDIVNVMTPTQGWVIPFDWLSLSNSKNVEMYKMVIQGTNDMQGALALENREDHIWVHLVESAPHNRVHKVFDYVGEHLFAFACLRSRQFGHDGYVAFDSKTKLISYYQKMLGAVLIRNTRMLISNVAAHSLIRVYL